MRLLRYILCALLFVTTSFAETININWVDGYTTYAQTTCEIGGDVILPTPPTKRGYTFKGWAMGYTRLEYIESTGTQYIDTGINGTNHTSTQIEVKLLHTPSSWCGLYGARVSNVRNCLAFFASPTSPLAAINYYNSDTGNISVANLPTGVWKTIKNVENLWYIDNDLIYTGNIGNFITPSITLFKVNNVSAITTVSQIKTAKIWEDGALVRNFIPAKRNSDNAVGMYDLVSNTFFENAGTGEFIAGPVAENQSFDE